MGVAVPEADREANPHKLHFEKLRSVPGIPLIDEDGKQVDEEEKKVKA